MEDKQEGKGGDQSRAGHDDLNISASWLSKFRCVGSVLSSGRMYPKPLGHKDSMFPLHFGRLTFWQPHIMAKS